MAFNSTSFLFVFLPVVLVAYYAARGRRARNAVLVLASFAFYAFGGLRVLLPLAVSIVFNHLVGRWIVAARGRRGGAARAALAVGIVGDLAVLAYFKYAGFAVANLNRVFGTGVRPPRELMLTGVSFFTFLAISYLIDVYRGRAEPAASIADTALYIADFPTLLAGPIVRWAQFAPQVGDRRESVPVFAEGVGRFVVGLAKKVLLAGALASLNAEVFAGGVRQLAVADAWLGAIAYTLQIYFDFSGYSDMAIGLGRMFGLMLPENFDSPYTADSVTDFWRRWHMTLSGWFRDYVYIPLGGNRVGTVRLALNLMIVWGLTGLWHGAAWVFIAWGLYYGVLLLLEKIVLGDRIERVWRPLRHAAVLVIVVVGWVLFSAPGLHAALDRLRVMFGLAGAPLAGAQTVYYLLQYRFELLAGVVLSMPVGAWLRARLGDSPIGPRLRTVMRVARPVAFGTLLLLSIAYVVSTTFQPFIYFKF